MSDLTKEQKELVKEAIDLVNKFPFEFNQRPDKIPEYLAKITLRPEILIQIFADISFKLYIIRHTKTEKDTERLCGFIMTLQLLEHLCETKYRQNLGMTVSMMKMAFPLVGDDTIFEELGHYIFEFSRTGCADLGAFFIFCARINNFCGESMLVSQDFFKAIGAHEGRSIKNRDSWQYLEPVFKECEKEIEPDFTPRQVGQLFNRHFYTKEGGTLEQILQDHGFWTEPEVDGDYVEPPEHMAVRMRKKYYKNFTDWLAQRKQHNRDLEAKIIDFLEKSFWKKKTPEQIFASNLAHIAKEDLSDFETIMNELKDFAKGLKVD